MFGDVWLAPAKSGGVGTWFGPGLAGSLTERCAQIAEWGTGLDPVGIAARYMAALAPGSYVVVSHSTDEFASERAHAASKAVAERRAT